MEEQIPKDAIQEIKNIKDGYGNGVVNIPAKAHDFIIPSVYQRLPEITSDISLGSFVNKRAGHNSGKSRNEVGGRKNFKTIKKMLKQVKKRLVISQNYFNYI